MRLTKKEERFRVTVADGERWNWEWNAKAGLLFLGVMAAASAILGVTVGAERLPPAWALNVGEDVVGIAVCALLYYGCLCEKQGADETTRLFMAMLLAEAIKLFLDAASWMLEGIPALHGLNTVTYVLFLCSIILLGYQSWRYIRVCLALNDSLARRCDQVMRAMLAPALALCLANLFVPLCFYVDEQGVYYETDGYLLGLIYLPAVFICGTLCLLRSKVPLRSKAVIGLFYIWPIVQGALYIGSDGAALPDPPLITITLMYLVLVSERSKALAATQTELDMAAAIQTNMLPSAFPAFPDRPEFEIYATMEPAKEVGGDFYDFFLVDGDHLAMVVADVSGKGVPAALFSMIAKTLLKTYAQAKESPEEVLAQVNAALCENNDEEMFVTVWLGILELSTGELTYADAGHERLLLYQKGAWSILPKAGGVALAALTPEELELVSDAAKSRNRTIHLNPGDAIFQYSDGITEAATADRMFFGEERLLDAANSAPSAKPEELLPHIRARLDAFVQGAPQNDDITMLGMRFNGSEDSK